MEKKKKLYFCFYCGSMIPEYDDKKGVCQYCGVKLHYNSKNKSEKNVDLVHN